MVLGRSLCLAACTRVSQRSEEGCVLLEVLGGCGSSSMRAARIICIQHTCPMGALPAVLMKVLECLSMHASRLHVILPCHPTRRLLGPDITPNLPLTITKKAIILRLRVIQMMSSATFRSFRADQPLSAGPACIPITHTKLSWNLQWALCQHGLGWIRTKLQQFATPCRRAQWQQSVKPIRTLFTSRSLCLQGASER